MYKRARNFILFVAIIILAIALLLSRMNFNATSADAANQLGGIGTPAQ